MLDLNRALGSNALSLNFQPAASSSLLNQTSSEFSSLNFTDFLASLQTGSEQLQNETSDTSMAQPFQSTCSLAVPSSTSQPAALNNSTFVSPTSAYQTSASGRAAPSAQSMYHGYTDSQEDASSSEQSASPLRAGSDSTQEDQTEPANTGETINVDGARVSQTSTWNQKEPLTASASGTVSPPTSLQQAPEKQTDGPIQSPVVSKKTSDVSGADAKKNQKAASTSPAESGQTNLIAQVPALGGKPVEKSKTHKEDAADGKGSAADGITGIGNDPVAVPNSDAAASAAGSTVPVDVGENAAALMTKSRSSAKTNSSSDLAFAVKIQGNAPIIDAASPLGSGSGTGPDLSGSNMLVAASTFSSQLAGMLSLSGTKVSPKAAAAADQGTAGLTNLTSTIPGTASSSANSDDDVAAADDVAPAAAVAEDQPVNSQPVKTVQVQITGADDQKVDLKLVEKSGSLTMSVRSTDSLLTKALQQNLPDLSTRLNDQQIRADWWRPDTQQTETSKNSTDSSGNTNNSANQEQGNQNKGNSGQQGGRGNPQPDWVEDHNISRKSNQNGTQFSWQL